MVENNTIIHPPRKNSIAWKKLVKVYFVLVLVVVYISAVLYFMQQKQNLNRTRFVATPTAQPTVATPTACPTITYRSQKDFEFTSEITISDPTVQTAMQLLFNDVKTFKKLFAIDEDVISVSYAPRRNEVIYLAGKDPYNPSDLRKVEIFDIATKTSRTIFSYQGKTYEETGMFANVDILRSIALSPDESKVMIITDKELFLYDLDSQSFIFSSDGKTDAPIFRDEEGNRHFFQTAQIAPDNRSAILSYGYYEGVSYFLLDFATNKITSLEKGGYAEGTFIEGWLDYQMIYFENKGGLETVMRVCTENTDGAATQCVDTNLELLSRKKVVPLGDDIYVLTKRSDTSVTYQGCNNAGRNFEFNAVFDSLSEFNTNTSKETEILHADATQVSGAVLHSAIIDFVPYEYQGSQKLLVKLYDEDKNTIYAFLDPAVPEKLTKIQFSAE